MDESSEESARPATIDLIVRVREGDEQALNSLIERYLPELRRWTSGRLPRWTRQGVDTDDIVQETLILVFRKIETFDYRGEGALLAYLRQAIINRVRNEIRNAHRRPMAVELDGTLRAPERSPLEDAIGVEAVEAY